MRPPAAPPSAPSAPRMDRGTAVQPASGHGPQPLADLRPGTVDTEPGPSAHMEHVAHAPSTGPTADPTADPTAPPVAERPTHPVEGPCAAESSASASAALRDAYRAVRDAGVHGLCFSPYVSGQGPGSQVSAEQIRDRLAVIRPYTRWVRSFSCTDGHEQTPAIAHAMGLKTLVGAWLGTDAETNAREIDGLIAVARAGHADIAAVGNEVLLREDMDEDALIAHIERVREALPGVPVGYVDAYYLFEQHPRITAACDVVMTNCYPFWEGCAREHALAYMQSMFKRTRAAAPGKRVLISETGWPDRGSPFHGALPSEEGAMRYFIDTLRWAQADDIELFYFAAFDEAWKVGAEGDVGAYWGLWDAQAQPKFA